MTNQPTVSSGAPHQAHAGMRGLARCCHDRRRVFYSRSAMFRNLAIVLASVKRHFENFSMSSAELIERDRKIICEFADRMPVWEHLPRLDSSHRDWRNSDNLGERSLRDSRNCPEFPDVSAECVRVFFCGGCYHAAIITSHRAGGRKRLTAPT